MASPRNPKLQWRYIRLRRVEFKHFHCSVLELACIINLRLESENAPPIVLHADYGPAALLCFVH